MVWFLGLVMVGFISTGVVLRVCGAFLSVGVAKCLVVGGSF